MRISDWSSDVCSSDLTPWFGQGVTQGAVFYLAGEGRSQIVRRFNGWAQYHGVSLEGAPIFLADRLPPLHDRLTAAEVIETIKRIADELFFNSGGIDPSLIVVDTVALALAGADENTPTAIGRASGREGVCKNVMIWVVVDKLQKKK